jgi:hypothetical protein
MHTLDNIAPFSVKIMTQSELYQRAISPHTSHGGAQEPYHISHENLCICENYIN